MKMTAVLFDLDGTLVDSSNDIASNLNRTLNDLGFGELPKELVMSHVGYGAPYLVEKCLSEFLPPVEISKALIDEGLAIFREHYLAHLIDETKPYPRAIEFLQALDGIPLGIISNKPEAVVHGVLHALEMDRYFRFMFGQDSTAWKKPDPRVIHYGLVKLGIPYSKSVWFVGDSFVDIHAARAAKVTAVAIMHGYTPVDQLKAEKPDILVKDFLELMAYL
ncbi:MAG: HAD-IA family hydrolase [Lentisphaeria bacterium]|nr:HAD-IA family hydrolase [Candidatus Neomarinimicrobiota bacterium]MCF7842770.1 HAD-IA family hydrolase [Lentisphaeria bacterium]